MGTMAIFPQEILDAIVNELDDDGAALRVCSMTSWSLLIPARRSIFHHIRIKQQDINYFGEFKHFDRDHKRLLDLSEILANDPSLHPHREGTPTLTSCIRHLDLQLASAGSHTFRGDTSAIMAAQDRWNAMNAPLPEVLHKLSPSHIELSLPCTWRQVDPSITSSILKLLRAPLIHTLDLSHIHGLPTNAVLHCPNLNDLRVRYVADQKSITDTAATEGLPCPIQPPPFEPSYPPPTLKYLTTTSDSNFLAALIKTPVNAVAFNNLQHLSFVDAWILSFDVESRVVETVAPTLRFLHIQSSNLDNRIDQKSLTDIPLRSLDLAHLKQLLTLDVKLEEAMPLSGEPLSLYLPMDMLTLLRKTSAPTSIQVLNLTFAWKYITPQVENPIFSRPEWDSLDGLLNGSNYPVLKEVAIVFQIGFDSDDDLGFFSLEHSTAALSPRLLALFPRLRRREGLDVQVSIKTDISYSM